MKNEVLGPPEPRANPDLVGHEAAERTLLESWNSGRLAHSWLISGPRGIGKATLAYRFACFLLVHGAGPRADEGPGLFGEALPPARPDSLYVAPENPVFQRIAGRGHGDLISVERRVDEKTGKRKTEIIIDDVRGIGASMSMTSAEGGWRIAVIDAADEMNRNAANAVLKVLEEPPKGAILLLVSHNPGRLLPTIRSRCRNLVLRPLEDATVADLVRRYLPNVGVEDATELARLSEGSVGRALGLSGEGGLDLYHEVTGLLETLPRLDVERLHALGDKVVRAGADDSFRTLSDLLLWWLGKLILFGAKGGDRTVSEGEQVLMRRLTESVALDRWLEVWEKINHLLSRVDAVNLDRKQVVLNAFLALESASRR